MEIVNITPLGVVDGEQSYSADDTNLINNSFISPTFGAAEDSIETYVKDLNGTIVAIDYLNTNYKPGRGATAIGGVYSTIEIDPIADARRLDVDRGTAIVKYNFFKTLLQSTPANEFWIKEISPSRTEIKVARQDLSNTDLLNAFNNFNALLGSINYYPDFLLNFGLDIQLIAVNAVFVQENDIAYVIFKLYEPLPLDIAVKSQFWVVQKIAESVEYEVSIEVEAINESVADRLRGPNYKVAINEKQGQTTPYYNYNTLFSTTVSSSYQQLQSWLEDKAIQINVDYSNFNNFIHFSSATERLLNFQYKVGLIEAYKADIAAGSAFTNAPTTIVATTNNTLQQNIDNIINKFDIYEYYLYFESASAAWPKSTSVAPYELYSVTSSQVINWLGNTNITPTPATMSMLYSASLYDNLNKDNLQYSMPSYIREDDNNQPYLTFLSMIGQHFDNIWVYYKDLSNRYSAENNPSVGISLDVVADALRGFGMQLYTNSNISDNIYYSMFGINDVGSLLPLTSSAYAQIDLASSSLLPLAGNDYLSQSAYLPPFEGENLNRYVTTFITPSTGVTASFGTIPPMQLEKEYYKRLYHNLPYLLKTKGTQRGVKALIACYGIPNSVLTVNEFGGYDIYAQPGIQQIQNEKVFTGSLLALSSSLLSPYTTNQFYQNNTERGSIDVEVGFSPADSINAHITGTLGNFNIMQYMGAPGLQYSSSYGPLEDLSKTYFDTYYFNRYNVWDFIRLIKFYNNSLFKSIKDYVPARASVTSAIIIKPHILERNKYARHEPVITRPEHSESIDMITIEGSDAPLISTSTAYSSSVQTLSGSVTVSNQYHFEPYTGEFGNSTIDVTTGEFPQVDRSSITAPWTSSVAGRDEMFGTYDLNYLYQNVSGAITSQRFLDIDFSTNQYFPVNYGLLTQSINNYPASLNDPYAPFAELQDYNYYLRRSILPRYSGSKSTSLKYNVYTATSGTYGGDQSYGLNAAIDRNSYKLGWVKTIPTESLNFYEKTSINLKYLVDADLNITELSANNDNVVEVQNIFKSGDPVRVSITDTQFPTNQATLNGTKQIYRGGYRYDPIIYRENNEKLVFTLNEPVSESINYIGVLALEDNRYRYDMGNNSAINGNRQPTNGTYTYYINEAQAVQSDYPMSYQGYDQALWNAKLSRSNQLANLAINTTRTQGMITANVPINSDPQVYAFNQVRFANVRSNTEPISNTYTPTGLYQYKVPRTSQYRIKTKYTFNTTIAPHFRTPIINGQYVVVSDPFAFKIALVVESNYGDPADETQWNIKLVSTINTINSNNLNISPSENSVFINSNYYPTNARTLKAECIIDDMNVACTEGEQLRLMFYIIDVSDIFGNPAPGGVDGMRFQIGGNGDIDHDLIVNSDKPYFEIYDELTSYTTYDYESIYDNKVGPLFATSSIEPDVLLLSPALSQYIQSQSIFTPSTSSETPINYTNIIDNFSIQRGDLIRVDKFKNINPTYYTVYNVETIVRPPVTLAGSFFVFTLQQAPLFKAFVIPYTSYTQNQFVAGDLVTISNTALNNTTVQVTGTYTDPVQNIALIYLATNSSIQAESPATPTFTFQASTSLQYKIRLTDNLLQLPAITGANFAILRPKVDETSVILNYRKRPGLVAQTLLIPQDASKTLISNAGNIFEQLNVQLG